LRGTISAPWDDARNVARRFGDAAGLYIGMIERGARNPAVVNVNREGVGGAVRRAVSRLQIINTGII